MNTLKLVMVALLGFIATSCGSKKMQTACGDLQTFTATPAYANTYGLPEIHFSTTYTSAMEQKLPVAGQENYNYNMFMLKDANGINMETVSLGNFKRTAVNNDSDDMLEMQLLTKISDMYQGAFDITEEFKGKATVLGKSYNMYRATGSIDQPEAGFKGVYRVQAMFILPHKDAPAGLLYIMQAHENSDIKSYEDFTNEGCTASIFQELRFID